MEEEKLSISNLNKKYGDNVIFRNFNINFEINKVNGIIGKSGCGKSTLLNLLSGIEKNDSEGFYSIENVAISYIFQDDRLIDWLTVENNIKIVAERFYNKSRLEELCNGYLDLVGIRSYRDYYPQTLSGGIRQRVNIARAFIYPSKVIIMDEPFKSIDIKNKQRIMENFKEILKKENRTVLFVTHDIEEALYLSDKIYILGGSPVELKGEMINCQNIDKSRITELI